MGWGAYVVHDATVSSFATSSDSEVDLGRAWHSVYLEIPTMISNAQLYIQVASDSGGDFRRVYHPSLNSSTVGTNVFAIVSATTNAVVPIPAGAQFLKVETNVVISFTAAFKIICADLGN